VGLQHAQEETAFLNKQQNKQSHIISQAILNGEEKRRREIFIHAYTYTYIYTNFPLICVIKIVRCGISHKYKNIQNYHVNTTNILPK